MTEPNDQNPFILQPTEKLALKKNSRGYSWEIVLLGKAEEQQNRLEEIDKWLQTKYGKKEDESKSSEM